MIQNKKKFLRRYVGSRYVDPKLISNILYALLFVHFKQFTHVHLRCCIHSLTV